MIAYTQERRTRCRVMLKRGWGRVPLLLSMGNAGVRARTKRITACMLRRAPTWMERTRKDNVVQRRKRGNGHTNKRASERTNEPTNQRRNREAARGVHRVAVKREQATPREPTAHRRHCGSASSSFLSPLAGPLVYTHTEHILRDTTLTAVHTHVGPLACSRPAYVGHAHVREREHGQGDT